MARPSLLTVIAVVGLFWPLAAPAAPPQETSASSSSAAEQFHTSAPSEERNGSVRGFKQQPPERARPQWVGAAAWKDSEADYFVVASGWWATTGEALSDAAEKAKELIRQDVFGNSQYSPSVMDEVLDTRVVRDVFVADLWLEQDLREYGTMHRAHFLVKITPETRDMLVSAYAARHELLLLKRAGSALALLFLVGLTLFAYLRIDDATGGYYRGRLGIGALLILVTLSAVVLHLGGWLTLIEHSR